MEQGYGDQPPADQQHGVSDLCGATINNEVDDQQKAQKRSDDQRGSNEPAPVSRGSIPWKTNLTAVSRLVSRFLAHSNSEANVHADRRSAHCNTGCADSR